MENIILEQDYKGYTIKIIQDNNPINPRTDYDNFGKMVCFHNRYNLGDKHNFHDAEDFKEFIGKSDIIALPLFLYDHSGITIKTTPFNCQFDSSKIGYIYTTYEDIRKECGVTRITAKLREKVIRLLNAEVKAYDRYLTGEVYGYQILKGEDIEDSCWGYIDGPKKIMEDRISMIEKHYNIQLELAI